jgi:hypothetical protein
MKHAANALVHLLMIFTCALTAAQKQPAREDPKRQGADTANIEPGAQLRQDVDAWPLLLNPANPPEMRVNATLSAMNARMAGMLRDCDDSFAEWTKVSGFAGKDGKPGSGDWERTVRVTMRGPRFLSMVATDGIYCGGAHPDNETIALVFDMETGALVDWTALIAKRAGASSREATGSDGSVKSALMLPALQAIYVAAADADCKDIFQGPQSFLLWPDAGQGALVAQAADLPHVAAACEQELKLTMNQARKLGFDETLLSAIEQAHQQQAGKPGR